MSFDHWPQKTLVTGMSGSGKSTLALQLLRRMKARFLFVFDPQGKLASLAGWRTADDTPGLVALGRAGQPMVFDPIRAFRGEMEKGFDFFCKWSLASAQRLPGKKVFVCDEIQAFTETGRDGIPKSFRELMDAGRHDRLDVLIIAQALGELNDKARKQVTEIYTLRHDDENCLKWLARASIDPEKVRNLPYPGGWMYRSKLTGEVKTNVHAKGN